MLIFLLGYLVQEKTLFPAVDLGRHLKNGELVFSHPQLLFENFYSYSYQEYPFINHHWFSGVIFFVIQKNLGWEALSFFNTFVIIVAFSISFWLAKKKSNFFSAFLFSFPVIFLLEERKEIRPEIFSSLFLMVYLYLLHLFREKRNPQILYFILPLQLLWANLHIYSVLGIFLVFLFFLEEIFFLWSSKGGKLLKKIISAPLLKLTLATLVISLFTPNFIKGLLYPFNIFKDYGYDIVENKSIFFLEKLTINHNLTIFKGLAGITWLFFLPFFWKKKEKPYLGLVLLILFTGWGFFALRNISLFGLVALPLVAEAFNFLINLRISQRLFKRFKPVLALKIIPFLVLVGCFYFVFGGGYFSTQGKNHDGGWGLVRNSEKLGVFLQREKIRGPLFNNYDLGSYLDYYLSPSERVFIDNRPEAYPKDFFVDYRKIGEEETWNKLQAKYNFNVLIFSHIDSTPWAIDFLTQRLGDNNWRVVYLDEFSLVFLKNISSNQELLTREGYSEEGIREKIADLFLEASADQKFYLTELAGMAGARELQEKLAENLMRDYPLNYRSPMLLASALLEKEREQNSKRKENLKKAQALVSEAIKKGAKLPSVYNRLGIINWERGDIAGAQAAWEEALKRDPQNKWTQYYLENFL